MNASTSLRLARCAMTLAVALAAVAMVLYPGGTCLNPSTQGYSFFQNSFSDLASTLSWSGQRNHASPFLLVAACACLLLGAAGCLTVLIPIYSSSLSSRWLVWAAGAFVLVAGFCLAAATVTPQDRYPQLHGRLTLFAIGSFPAGTAMLGITSLVNPRMRWCAAAVWFALTFVVLAWGSCIFGRQPTTPSELAIPVTLQKLVGLLLIAALAFQCNEAERLLKEA